MTERWAFVRESGSENGKPSGLGETAAHGEHMDKERSRDKHERKEEKFIHEESSLPAKTKR